jgi:hypothetical protein
MDNIIFLNAQVVMVMARRTMAIPVRNVKAVVSL